MADIGWRRRRGSSPAAPTGARQRAGLTPLPPPTHFHASGRRFTHNSSGQSKNPLTAITVSTAISEMSSQIIALKGRINLWNPAEFWLWRLFALELRRWGIAGRQGCLRGRHQLSSRRFPGSAPNSAAMETTRV